MATNKPKVIGSSPQKTTGGNAKTKNAAKRKANSGSGSSSYIGFQHQNTIAQGLNNRPRVGGNVSVALPGGTQTVTPIAPPKIDPFLTPTDEAQEQVENGQWDDYIAGLLQQQSQQDTDVGLKVGDIDRSLSQGLEANDWNSAARGIANSSIKDQNKAQMVTQAGAARQAETDKQKSFHDYTEDQQKQVNTVYKPAIAKKYNALRVENAQKAQDAWNAAHPQDPSAAAAQAAAAPSAPSPAPSSFGTAQANAQVDPLDHSQTFGADKANAQVDPMAPKNVVKNGSFYHVYNYGTANERWVYVRKAS